jgi:hypothetical protein
VRPQSYCLPEWMILVAADLPLIQLQLHNILTAEPFSKILRFRVAQIRALPGIHESKGNSLKLNGAKYRGPGACLKAIKRRLHG